jgi:hypothetical protein
MARMYLKKHLDGSFIAADEFSAQTARKFKAGEIYRSDVVKPRSLKHHRLCFALLQLTFANQERYTSFEMFRKAVAIEAGHVSEIIRLDGEVILEAGSLSFDALDEVEFTRVFGAMMTVCANMLRVSEPELEAEVSRYADEHYGVRAA